MLSTVFVKINSNSLAQIKVQRMYNLYDLLFRFVYFYLFVS